MDKLLKHIYDNALEAYIFDGNDEIQPFVFMSVSKCAKTSIWIALDRNIKMRGNRVDRYTIDKYLDMDYTDYYKFCFVRNTYDRLVSAYSYFRITRDLKNFGYFLEEYLPNLDKYLYFNEKSKKRRLSSHLQRQHRYIEFDIGDTFVDDIYSFENINEDWKSVCKVLGLKNKRLRHYRRTREIGFPIHYSKYYSEDMLGLIRETYGRELDLFGFKCTRPNPNQKDNLLLY